MFKFSLLRQIFGLILIFASWIDPFQLGEEFQIVAFILGFDIMTIIPKVIIFGIDYFWDISGYGLFLLLQLAEDLVFHFFTIGRIIELVAKPTIVFLIIFVNGFGFWLALIVALIDLMLNLQNKAI
ncbi:MAG: hypothetical protein QXM68_03315 [Candidatus Aenigmatarchaeota archaeon]|nr:hypothetical protein [Candidatus Aenigmarchaeota archaeon]